MSINLGDFNISKIKINGQVIYNCNRDTNILTSTKENITHTLLDKTMRKLTK